MIEPFTSFVATQKAIADQWGIGWKLSLKPDGKIRPGHEWNLSKLVGAPGPVYWLSDLGFDAKTLTVLNQRLAAKGRAPVKKMALSSGWQDLIKSVVIEQILVRKNTPSHAALQVMRPMKVLGTCVQGLSGSEPWDMNGDDVQFACEVAASVQPSGKLGELVISNIKSVIDAKHLCSLGPFFHLVKCETNVRRKRGQQTLGSLSERKHAELLPDVRALWELVRIVFTEKPQTFVDAIRFAQIRVMFICGFRVGEVCRIPLDWRRTREYVSVDGVPLGELGGVSKSLMIRHFAEKMKGRESNSVELIEAAQHVPIIFEQILCETLDRIATMTEPLRERLRLQCETRRYFPEFAENERLGVEDLYVRLSGNPETRRNTPDHLIANYRESFSRSALEAIRQYQAQSPSGLKKAVHRFWARAAENGLAKLLVRDVEVYVRKNLPTKLPDTAPLPLQGGRKMPPHEMLFLAPKRALIEMRNGGICDITRYFSVGLVTAEDIILNLSAAKGSIFDRYGDTEEDRKLGLNTHSLRHLQNTELFRQGIADTIITKRFNRRSVKQSYEYDHRSLAEQLAAMDLPKSARLMHPRAQGLAGLIKTGKASGPLVDQFKRIQKDRGDDEAFLFLAGEASGFHATPYGFCINDFMVDPCAKHLQCFDGCKYLVACMLDRQRSNLEKLRERILRTVKEIEHRRKGVGRDNQLKHAESLLANIEKLLAAEDGELVFEDGRDLSDRLGHNQGPLIDAVI